MISNPIESLRLYQLQLNSQCSQKCSYCSGLGFLSSAEKNQRDLITSLRKAKEGQYQGVLIPCSAIHSENLPLIVQTTQAAGLLPILQLNSRQLTQLPENILDLLNENLGINLIIGNHATLPEAQLLSLKEAVSIFYVTVVVHNRNHGLEAFRALPEWVKSVTYFQFPYLLESSQEFFSPKGIYEFLKRFRNQFPDHCVKPAPGVEIFDPASSDLDHLEPILKPVYETFTESENSLDFSIVIRSQNSYENLKKCLHMIRKQDFSKDKFELIIVDDGSNDGTPKKLIQEIHQNPEAINLKVLVYPNYDARKQLPNHLERIGICKNLGAKVAEGKYLVFLDDDLLVPKKLLSNLLVEHHNTPVVQLQKLQLNENFFWQESLEFSNSLSATVSQAENNFWNSFYSRGHQWETLNFNWRYFSSSALSIHRQNFYNLGWFRKNYKNPQLMDADLGYRVVKSDLYFKLAQINVYKLYQKKAWYSRNFKKNPEHLGYKESAKAFFHNNLDTEIFENLKSDLQ